MRTCIKFWTSSNFGQLGPLTTDLAALEVYKISQRLITGKCFLHASSFIFDRIIITVAGNQDRHKSSRSDLGTLDSSERSLPFGLLVQNLDLDKKASTDDKWHLAIPYSQSFGYCHVFVLLIIDYSIKKGVLVYSRKCASEIVYSKFRSNPYIKQCELMC